MIDELLGPFAVSGDALLAQGSEDGSLTSRDSRFLMLSDTVKAAGVDMDCSDWIALRWLADQHTQAVSTIAGWIRRARLAGVAAGAGTASASGRPSNHIGPPRCANTATGPDPDPATTRRDLP
jgi:hypothetical protein